MATNKLTEKPIVEGITEAATVVITQPVTANGETKTSLRRATIKALVDALKANGINEDVVKTEDFEKMYSNLVKSVDPIDTGIRITFWDETTSDIAISAGGLAFDSVSYDQDSGYLHITKDGEDVIDPCFIGGGGGGGSASGTVVKLENTTGSASMTVAYGEPCVIRFSFADYDASNEQTNSSGALELSINNRVVLSKNIEQGNHSIDISNYLSEGANKVKIKVSDEDDNYATKTWTVNAVALSLSATFDSTAINTGSLVFRYTPVGNNIEKNVHFKIDGTEVASSIVTASNRQQTQIIPAQSHGAHRLEVYATATVDGVDVRSNTLIYDVIWVEEGNDTPIIACGFTGNATQYSTTLIPYIVYSPTSITSSISLAVNGSIVSQQTVDRTVQTWSYKAMTAGTDTLTITCGNVVKTITIAVESSGVDIQPITTGLILDLNPQGHTNNDTNKTSFGYTDKNGVNHPLLFSSNFDWNNGGFQTDENGDTYFCVKCGTTATFDCSLFADDAMRNGKEIKLIFKATNCRDYDAQIASCISDGIGFVLQAQKASISSEQTSMSVPYCEDSRIEMDINIEPDSSDRAMMIWLEGVPSRVAIYEANDNFTQDSPAALVIGSNDCDVHIYRIKAYENDLTRNEIHENWIADAPDAEEMLSRYNRNNIYDQNGNIDIQKLITAAPNLHIFELAGPRMTTGKKDPVYGSITHTYTAGGNAKKFTAENVIYKVQGTSSSAYGESAYNLDLDFKEVTEWKDGNGNDLDGWKFNDNSIAINYINLKVNVASSENANNCVLQSEYNDYQPYINPARQANSKVRDTMYGEPMVIFFTNTSNETIHVSSRDLAPGETMLYACGDMMNSKKNTKVFGQDGSNNNQCCIEISNNTNNQCLFKSDDISDPWDGDHSFEFRYCPEGEEDRLKLAWKRVLTWVVSTNRAEATDALLPSSVTYGGTTYTNDTAEYRAAKFKAEYQDYFVKNSLLYHYLFTERHMMVDNRAKNVFASTDDGVHWDFTKDYDNDTADGNDNEGGLTLSYGLEDIDTIGTKDVFNASSSVLWVNVRDLLFNELRELFITLENKGAWSASRILARFKAHQSARPEALVVEDMWQKYIDPFTLGGADAYLKMMLGTKEDQRNQFETYQEMYCSSKYRAPFAESDKITFRAYTPTEWGGVAPGTDITITSYADMYINLVSGSGISRLRAKRGTPYTMTCPIDTLNDTEIYICSASNISSVGDLAPLYVGYFNIATAKKLRHLKLGDGSSGYQNTNVETIGVGNNTLLETIDIQNCPNITQGLDLTGCPSLNSLEAKGSGLTGVSFAKGGNIITANLPAVASFSAVALNALETLTFESYTALRTARIEACPTIDTLDFIQQATGLTRIRILDVEWRLQSTDLLDRLVALRGLDESDHNLERSVITGSVFVPIMRQSKLSAYNTAWSDLEVSYDTLIQQYLVTFKNWDGTTLSTQYVDRADDAIDPVANGDIEAPTRPSSVSTNYTYNGWDGSLSQITETKTFTAQYTERVRQYTVKWYSQGVVMDTQTVGYGSEAIYNGSMPERNDEETQFVYYLFTGWDKSTGFITGDIDVNAQWLRGELPNAGKRLEEMNEAEIYSLIKSGNEQSFMSFKDRTEITFGFQPEYTNIPHVDLADNLVLDGATYQDTGIQLFKNGLDDAWTLVVDCKYDTTTSDATMICCMQEEGYMGFKLKYNGGPAVQYSTNTYQSGATTYREIFVIRHEPGSRNVKVYSSKQYTNSIGYQELVKSIDTQTDAHLYLGATVTDGGQVGDFATGKLYSCRLWYGDLGEDVCHKIVSWPREKYTFEVGNFGKYKLASSSVTTTKVDFICASLLERIHVMNSTNTNAGGYKASSLAAWMDTRVADAFPLTWQQMMKMCKVKYIKNVNNDNKGEIGEDYYSKVWVPSYIEMQGGTSEPWIYECDGGYINFFTSNAKRIKFRGYTLPVGYKTFSTGSDPALVASNDVKEGDVWINTSNSSIGYVYRDGQWFSAGDFWLRGASISYSTYFGYVNNFGGVSSTGSYASNSFGVCPRFSI